MSSPHLICQGQMPPLADVGPYYEAQEPSPLSTPGAAPRQGELPLGGNVVTFPELDTGA